jgi:amino acid adenylation domain-containing protein
MRFDSASPGSSNLASKITGARSPMSERTLADKPPLNATERQRLKAWNATETEYPLVARTPDLIAAQCAATPDAVALVAGGQQLSYGELNRRANQLAHHLQALGVQPDVLVGCYMDRSLDMVVALLGILKAGGAYVPLDSTYPRERIEFMLSDARTAVLITQQHLASQLSTEGTHLLCLDADQPELARLDTADPTSGATMDDIAYVIYTSGTTGQPKGVQITHKGLLNLAFWHRRAFAITPSDRATQLTSPAFDATGWELWPYLATGASIYFPDEDTRGVPASLGDWLVSQRITVTFLPTPLAERIMTLEWPQATTLRLLLTGADTLHLYPSPTLPFTVVNNYGPTEATVVATSGVVPPIVNAGGPPSIGRPIANTRIYILDEDLRQVPIGEPGELYIGGDGLARGYLNRPDLTDQRFIPNPVTDEPGARLYRTGDMARYLPDGQIAFMGRFDHQVKIRGYRIEADEVACLLNSHPAIQMSVVVDREDVAGDKRLVAYVTPVPGVQVRASSLRDSLSLHLPDYMIPSVFVILEEQPLTPNGKVDRAALPAPNAKNTLRDGAIAIPSSPIEERLIGIVTALLNVEEMSIDDNFFLLGGNSLMGAQLIVQTAETFGIDLALRTLFERPTVRQLAAEIERLIVAKVQFMSDDEVLRLLGERA